VDTLDLKTRRNFVDTRDLNPDELCGHTGLETPEIFVDTQLETPEELCGHICLENPEEFCGHTVRCPEVDNGSCCWTKLSSCHPILHLTKRTGPISKSYVAFKFQKKSEV